MARRMGIKQFNGMVRRAVEHKDVKRVRFMNVAIPTAATTTFTLLACDDDPDYDLNSDGSTVAECQPFSKIIDINLQVRIEPAAGNTVEWILVKDPDGLFTASQPAPASLFTADVTLTTMALRKYVLKYGWFKAVSGIKDAWGGRLRIKRQAVRRAGSMLDGDKLLLIIANPSAGAGDLIITGTITLAGR